jgi:hypothetical protein
MNLIREGMRDQKIRRRTIATVSNARAAVVMGMYMPFVGYRDSKKQEQADGEIRCAGVGGKKGWSEY